MSYWTTSQMSQDSALTARIQVAAAQEIDGDPWAWTARNMLTLAASPGWDEAWASALANGNEHPGRDEAVITDGMILSAVQAHGA